MRRILWLMPLLLALGALGVADVLPVGAQSAPGPSLTAFDASAGADGVRVGVVLNGAPLTPQIVDVGGPTAQAVLTGFGKSQAFASMPYPGDAVLTLPPT